MSILDNLRLRFTSWRPSSAWKPQPLRSDLMWIWHNGQWVEVCETCGGNCGQCGLTGRIGCSVPASMDRLIAKLEENGR